MTDRLPWASHAVAPPDAHTVPHESPYAHATSFLRRPWRSDLEGVEVGILGVPFDTATSHRPGARFGPRALRQISATLAWEQRVYGFDVAPAYDVAEITALAGATLALNFLCLFALTPGRAPAGARP